MSDPRDILCSLFDAAVDVARPAHILPQHLPAPAKGRTIVLGLGKAAAAMAATVEDHWPGPLEGLVVTRYGHHFPTRRIEVIEASHPVPDAAGADAARRLLALGEGLGPDDLAIVLISGGGSALTTLLPEGVSMVEAAGLNRELLASGATIAEINCLRRHLSQFAGGRLAAAIHPAPSLSLMISDVPGDDPVNIASGPTVGDPSTLADARAVAAKYRLNLSPALHAALSDPENESLKPGDPRLARAETRTIATPMAALKAAAAKAGEHGLATRILGDALQGEARELGAEMAREALALQADLTAPFVLISGGETSVTLPKGATGTGGRNVDFLLGMAQALQGAPGIHALAADTDGIDGAAEVAGAIITPTTIARAGPARLAAALRDYDGHGFFAELGDQVITGPTLTNVNDFRAVLIAPPHAAAY